MLFIVAIIFVVGGIAACAASSTGLRGLVGREQNGYVVPLRVSADPRLCREANRLVACYGLLTALLCFPPIIISLYLELSGPDAVVSTWTLAAFAAYGFVVACVGGYPLERIERLE